MALFSTVAVIDVLESIPEVTPDTIEAVMRELGILLSITIDDMMPVLGRCGVKPRQGMRARGIVESGPVATVSRVSPSCACASGALLPHNHRPQCVICLRTTELASCAEEARQQPMLCIPLSTTLLSACVTAPFL